MNQEKFNQISEQIKSLCHDNNIPAVIALINDDTLRVHVCSNFPEIAMEGVEEEMCNESLRRAIEVINN